MEDRPYTCPTCNSHKLILKYAAKYIYSYRLDADAPGHCNTKEYYSYLYDQREQAEAENYIECADCGAQYPCILEQGGPGLDPRVLHKALENFRRT